MGLTDIRVSARFLDDAGRALQTSASFDAVLPGGEQTSIATGWMTADPASLSGRIECAVSGARVAD